MVVNTPKALGGPKGSNSLDRILIALWKEKGMERGRGRKRGKERSGEGGKRGD